ncbi:MAG: MSCRAMM family protein [Thermoleophilia bacterium]
MAGSIIKQPLRLGMLLLILFGFIAALLAAQIILSDSSEQAANGPIVEQAGAVTTSSGVNGPVPAVPGATPGGAPGGAFGAGTSVFTNLDTEWPQAGSDGEDSSGRGPASPASTGSLSGHVVSGLPAGSPLARITVYLADSTGAFAGPSARTAENGGFEFPGLAPGDYRLFFFDSAGVWKSAWYGGAPPAGLTIHIAAGGAVSISQALLPAEATDGSISGHVSDGSGKGLIGVSVLAYLVDEAAGVKLLFQSEVVTDANGDYRITGLPPASSSTGSGKAAGYKIEFVPARDGYASQWFSDQPTYQTAKIIELHAGETAGGVDACLGGGGTVSGRVTIENGNKPAAFVMVDIFDEAGIIVDTQLTTADGYYRSDPLPAGAYAIRVTSRSSQYEGEWYNNRKEFSSADKVAVVSGKDSGGIDINLDPPPPPAPPDPPALHGAAPATEAATGAAIGAAPESDEKSTTSSASPGGPGGGISGRSLPGNEGQGNSGSGTGGHGSSGAASTGASPEGTSLSGALATAHQHQKQLIG